MSTASSPALPSAAASAMGPGPRDLDEIEEIAEPEPMRLFLCDMALERAQLVFVPSS